MKKLTKLSLLTLLTLAACVSIQAQQDEHYGRPPQGLIQHNPNPPNLTRHGVKSLPAEPPPATVYDAAVQSQATEFHVEYVGKWRVRFGDRRVGFKVWRKEDAERYALDEAKYHKPALVIIHDRRTGREQKRIRVE
jgi:hypothetical protein